MKNRFLRRGLLMLIAGIALNIIGYVMMERNLDHYGWPMIIGTILFGIGFITIFYSFVRKVEAQGIIEERAVEAEKKAMFENESKEQANSPFPA